MKPNLRPALMALMLLWLAALACSRAAPNATAPTPPAPATFTPAPTPPPTWTPAPPPTWTPQPAARVTSGDHALFNGDWETALAEYEKALKGSADPEIQAAALLGVARARLMGRNDYEANRALQTLLKDYPLFKQRAQVFYYLAQLHSAQERHAEAAEAYTRYLELAGGVIDAYIYDRRGDAYFAAARYAEAARDFEKAFALPGQLDRTLLRMKTARAYALGGDYPTALNLYDDLYQTISDENTRALIDLRRGEIYASQGLTEQAHAAYLEAVQNYPTSPNAYDALVALVEAGVPVNELQRGIVDYSAGQYGVALAALNRYLQNAPADPASAHYYYALTQRKLGNYAEAVERWSKVIQDFPDHPYWDKAWDEKAYTQWAFLDQYPEAVQTLLTFVEKYPAHPRAAEFLFDAALVAEMDGKLEQAASLWARLAREYPGDERSLRALFLLGVTQYRLKEYQQALDAFQRHLASAVSLHDRAAAQFWIGKAQAALGDAPAARLAWEKAAETDPTGYYSERARDLLFNRSLFEPPLSYDLTYDVKAERMRAEAWLRATFALPPETDLSGLGTLAQEPALQRGATLLSLGQYDYARAEFEALRQSVSADAAQTYRLANYLVEVGMYRSAILAARQILNLAGMDDADTLNAPSYINRIRFGAYYSDLVIPLAKQYNFHPLFLFSLIRQESLFDGFVRSSAGANGLMQIIPATGQGIAADLGWPENYIQDDLTRPLVNLTLGVDYLDTQRKAFDGNLYAALAAYNGGPENARRWLKLAPDDPDLFLEVIRYAETRNYIRGVYELFNIYRLLYDRTP
jgi:soluble lytic murein transglycosylase